MISNLEMHLEQLFKDIHIQPKDDGHTAWAEQAIRQLLPVDIKSILDVGCGSGFCEDIFKGIDENIDWIGQDYLIDGLDFTFLPYEDRIVDLVFARHVLEHSPMPLITLMEWARISKKYAIVILPTPEYWQVFGRNHYYVLPKYNWWNLFDVAGWKIIKEKDFTTSEELFMEYHMVEIKRKKRTWNGPPKIVEFRYLLEKKK